MEAEQLRQVIDQAKAGEAEGFEALLTAYNKRLYGYFFRATASHHDAEDLLGELTLKLVRMLPKYSHQGRFEPWLFRIAANMVRDRIRRRRVRPTALSLSAEDEDGRSMAADVPAAGPDVDQPLLTAEASLELKDAMERLDDTTRQMILMRHFGELSFKEIAEMFDCPLGTALAKVHRGLKSLRKMLSEEQEDEKAD